MHPGDTVAKPSKLKPPEGGRYGRTSRSGSCMSSTERIHLPVYEQNPPAILFMNRTHPHLPSSLRTEPICGHVQDSTCQFPATPPDTSHHCLHPAAVARQHLKPHINIPNSTCTTHQHSPLFIITPTHSFIVLTPSSLFSLTPS